MYKIIASFLSIPIVFLVAKASKYLISFLKLWHMSKNLDSIVGTSKKHWFWGHLKQYPFSEEGLLKAALVRVKEFPVMFNFWYTNFFANVELCHPDAASALLNSKHAMKHFGYKYFEPWVGKGLLLSGGHRWSRNRKLLTPAFHLQLLKSYVKTFNEVTDEFLQVISQNEKRSVDVFKVASLLTLDNVVRCATSTNLNCLSAGSEHGHPYIEAVIELSEIIMERYVSPLYAIDWIFWRSSLGKRMKHNLDIVHGLADKIIKERRKMLETSSFNQNACQDDEHFQNVVESGRRIDFLDIVLQSKDENGDGLNDKEIRDEVDTLLLAGHDTTAAALTWTLYHLAKHQEIQEKCRREILKVIGKKQDIEWDALGQLQYLTMVIKESLRLTPPVFTLARLLDKSVTIHSKLAKSWETVIPAKSNITVNVFAMHRNACVWENPLDFIPERFTAENVAKRPAFAFIPFSAGHRNCIGQNFALAELKVALAKIVGRWKVMIDPEASPVELFPSIILKSKRGILLKFIPLKEDE